MKLSYESKGSFDKTEAWLRKMASGDIFSALDRYGAEGARALSAATPQDSGLTAGSWTYEIENNAGSYSIIWGNTNIVDGTPVAILLQVGHGTGTGGYVAGRDYINPALRPIFDRIANDAWKVVTA